MTSPRLPLDNSPSRKSHGFDPSARKRSLHYCWSKVSLDILEMVFERLGFADFQRAKSVCSSWRSASRQSKPNNQIPWMTLLPTDKNYCLLFNPEENHKVYKTQDIGDDFAKYLCVATYRSWLLMQPRFDEDMEEDIQYNLYILDLLTLERINLPSFESGYQLASSSILWIDENTKDYIIIGMIDDENAVFFKKGDNSWKQTPWLSGIEECCHMVYKDHKLYCLNHVYLKIFDLSTETPIRIFKISVQGCVKRPGGLCVRLPGTIPCELTCSDYKNNVVVTLKGDILIVNSIRLSMSRIWNFEIYKMMDSSSKGNEYWEEIVSLGDETILLDLGITVFAKDSEGIRRNSIYFNGRGFENSFRENDIFIFNLDTKIVEQPHRFVSSPVPCSNVRWFFPSFKR